MSVMKRMETETDLQPRVDRLVVDVLGPGCGVLGFGVWGFGVLGFGFWGFVFVFWGLSFGTLGFEFGAEGLSPVLVDSVGVGELGEKLAALGHRLRPVHVCFDLSSV